MFSPSVPCRLIGRRPDPQVGARYTLICVFFLEGCVLKAATHSRFVQAAELHMYLVSPAQACFWLVPKLLLIDCTQHIDLETVSHVGPRYRHEMPQPTPKRKEPGRKRAFADWLEGCCC
jgi:hypothetical protein